jgi:hypothetical protein
VNYNITIQAMVACLKCAFEIDAGTGYKMSSIRRLPVLGLFYAAWGVSLA